MSKTTPGVGLTRLVVTRLGPRAAGLLELIEIDQIVFAFQGSEAARRLVAAAWAGWSGFRDARVYVRTDQGVFRTTFRSLKQFRRQLPECFEPANRGLLANLTRVRWIELPHSGRKALGFILVGRDGRQEREWVVMSRRGTGRTRARFGAPARTRPYRDVPGPGKPGQRPQPAPRVDLLEGDL